MREDKVVNIVFVVVILGLSLSGIIYLSSKMLF